MMVCGCTPSSMKPFTPLRNSPARRHTEVVPSPTYTHSSTRGGRVTTRVRDEHRWSLASVSRRSHASSRGRHAVAVSSSHLIILRLRDIAERLRGGVHDVEELDDGGAIVRDGDAALVVDQLIHAWTRMKRAAPSQQRAASARVSTGTRRQHNRTRRDDEECTTHAPPFS